MSVGNKILCVLRQIYIQKLQVCSCMHELLLQTDIKVLSLNDIIQQKF